MTGALHPWALWPPLPIYTLLSCSHTSVRAFVIVCGSATPFLRWVVVHCVDWARIASRECVVHVDLSTGLLVCVHVCDIWSLIWHWAGFVVAVNWISLYFSWHNWLFDHLAIVNWQRHMLIVYHFSHDDRIGNDVPDVMPSNNHVVQGYDFWWHQHRRLKFTISSAVRRW